MAPRTALSDRLLSFRTRLRLFFVLIVVVPMIAVTFVVFRLIDDSEKGQADARIAARQELALAVYYDARDAAARLALLIGRDQPLADALRARDDAAARDAATRLLRATGARRIVLTRGEDTAVDVGDPRAAFPVTRDLVEGGRGVAQLQVSAQDALTYARDVRRRTGLDVVVRRAGAVLAATVADAPTVDVGGNRETVRIDGKAYRGVSFGIPDFRGSEARVTLLEPEARTADDIHDARLLTGLILAGFFLLASTAAILVSRSLHRQIGEFLRAARRLGAGDFSASIPTRGHDEFAALGEEFNKMSSQLEARVGELGEERRRLELSLRRLGETFASNLDRDALLEIVVHTAVDAVNADGARVAARGDRDDAPAEVARAGADRLPAVAADAEAEVLGTGRPAAVSRDGATALAHPLQGAPGPGATAWRVGGLVSVWRVGRPFSAAERELFEYLAARAAVSLENVGFHESVERQAVTDELTGLSNRRRFDEAIAAEVERSRRFRQDVGLVLLDIDDFKAVNDTHGHQQGDIVLREVARILKASSREIDEPARYGGEELAVVLPGTDLEGAFNLAERVRRGIGALEVPIPGGREGERLQVTASFGAASLPTSATDLQGLVAAADEALYEAKRQGKNRTVRAG